MLKALLDKLLKKAIKKFMPAKTVDTRLYKKCVSTVQSVLPDKGTVFVLDIKHDQIPDEEQKIVIRTLAEEAGGDACRFLEIGTWCGDSAVVLGSVAREKGGILYCVDWWRGNEGTELKDIASKEDIFSVFWERIRAEGLEDVVIPIRGRSEQVAEVLRDQSFDLVFIDGDHRYEGCQSDIRLYSPLVRAGGILCGHDCEGRLSDFEMSFLEVGKGTDYHETVHCGVVLAVGEAFSDYSIDYCIWSVRAVEEGGWEPTSLSFPGLRPERQLKPSPAGFTGNHTVMRYGKLLYAVPRNFEPDPGKFDVRDESHRQMPGIITARTMEEMEGALGEHISKDIPILLTSYKGYNLVRYGSLVYAVPLSLGSLDLCREEDRHREGILTAETTEKAQELVDEA